MGTHSRRRLSVRNESEVRAPAAGRRAFILLVALTLVAYWPVLLGRIPLPAEIVTQFPPWESVRGPDWHPREHAEMGDLVTELYPWKAFTRSTIARGSFPLWNPHILLGAPFVGDLQTGLFYPLNLVYYLLPTAAAWSLSFLLRTLLAGAFTFLLARRLGASSSGAIAASIAFAFSGWVTAFQARPHLDTVLWLPAALLCVDQLQRRRDPSSAVLTGGAFALPVLAGQPESAAHVTIAGMLFVLFRLAFPPSEAASRGARLRFAALFAAAGVLAFGLAAVQMLPALEFIGQLGRGVTASWGAKPLREIATFLSRDLGANPNSAGVEIPECSAYAGMLTLMLAPLAAFHRNRRDAVFFGVMAAGGIAVAFGIQPAFWLSQHVPILRGIPNWRMLGLADLALAILAGLGFSAVETRLREGRRFAFHWWGAFGALFISAAAGTAPLVRSAGSLLSPAAVRQPLSSAVLLLAAAALIALALSGRLRPRAFASLSVSLLAADLVSASYGFIPFVRGPEIFPEAPVFRFLSSEPEPNRVASVDGTYGSSFEMMYGLDSPTGFTVMLRRTEDLLRAAGFRGGAPGLVSEELLRSPNRLLDLMNVKHLVSTTWNHSAELLASRPSRFRLVFSDRAVRVFENLRVLPRAFLVPMDHASVYPNEHAVLARVSDPDFDPSAEVALDASVGSGTTRLQRRAASSPASAGDRVVAHASAHETVVQAVAVTPSIVVLSQAWYPGWTALVDGAERPLLRVDYGFQGVAVEPGPHEVRFVYRPASLRWGIGISATAVMAAAICFFAERRRAPAARRAAA